MKGNIHKLYLYAALTLLFSCCTKNRTEIEEITPKSDLVNKIRKKVFVELLVEDDLRPFGTSAQMMDEIKMLGFSFNYHHEIDIETARKLMLKASNTVLNKINDCTEIRSYLIQHPFKPQNVEIGIFIRNSHGSELPPEKLQIIIMDEGIIYYKNFIRDERRFLTTIHEETYEEALDKLRQEESEETSLKDPIKL
jgi:hypothetical protein